MDPLVRDVLPAGQCRDGPWASGWGASCRRGWTNDDWDDYGAEEMGGQKEVVVCFERSYSALIGRLLVCWGGYTSVILPSGSPRSKSKGARNMVKRNEKKTKTLGVSTLGATLFLIIVLP